MDIEKREKWNDGILEYWAQENIFLPFTSFQYSIIPGFTIS